MELDVWSGDWGIPSVNPKCLSIMAYTKFSKAPVDVRGTNNPWRSQIGTLPVLRHENVRLTQITDMFNHLRALDYGCEFELSATESADMVAFIAMVEKKLAPAVNHLFWIDAKSYSDLTRSWYGRAVGLPLSLYYPNRYRDKMEKQVYDTHPNLSEDDIDTKIYKDARECLNHLSSKLGNSEFFFGTNPTALDAIVYGYLAPLLKAPLHVNALSGHLKAIENLPALVRKIQYRYFSKEVENMTIKEDESAKESKADSEEFPNRRRNIILSGLFATVSMVTYAVLSGLVHVEITNEEEDEDDDLGDEAD